MSVGFSYYKKSPLMDTADNKNLMNYVGNITR